MLPSNGWLAFLGTDQGVLLKKNLNHDSFCCQVSQVWFSERERIFTTAAMAGAAAFGAMIGM